MARGALAYADHHGATHIFCGHTHVPTQAERNGVQYFNSGAWVDQKCTYITVDEQGVEIQNYTPASEQLMLVDTEGHSEIGPHQELDIPSHAFYRPVRG